MPVYIEKYGDLFGCHHSGTTTTRKDRATQPMDHGSWKAEISNYCVTLAAAVTWQSM